MKYWYAPILVNGRMQIADIRSKSAHDMHSQGQRNIELLLQNQTFLAPKIARNHMCFDLSREHTCSLQEKYVKYAPILIMEELPANRRSALKNC